jgi:hypothetical protein
MAVVNGISMPYVIYIYINVMCVCAQMSVYLHLYVSDCLLPEKKTGFQEPSSNVFF